MRILTKLLLAGAGAAAIATAAFAAADRAHLVNVAMPDGTVAQVYYVGDVAPQSMVAPDAIPVLLAAADPFAMFDRISLAMDRQMDAILQQAAMTAQTAPAANGSDATLRSMPYGKVSYSYTTYSSGNGESCNQSVQVTSLGANQAPKVVKQSEGYCNAMNSSAATPAVQLNKPEVPALAQASLETTNATEAKGPII